MGRGLSRTLLCLAILTACTEMPARLAERAADESRPSSQPAAGKVGSGFALADAPPAAPLPTDPWPGIEANGMIIRTGSASLEIDSLDRGLAAIRALTERTGGYVANSQIQAGNSQFRTATLELKVPAARFDQLLTGLKPVGKVENVSVSAQDVGEEFTDLSARVSNAHRLEQRLIELLATRTGKLSDVLEIERELARVREEIERMEGRLRYLKARSAVSSLSVTLHEPMPLVGEEGSPSVLAEAFRQAWRNFISLSAGAVAALGFVVPVGALGLATVALIRRRWRTVRSTA